MITVERVTKVTQHENNVDSDVIELIEDSKEELIKSLENEIELKNSQIFQLRDTNEKLSNQLSIQNHRIKSLAHVLTSRLNSLTINSFKQCIFKDNLFLSLIFCKY